MYAYPVRCQVCGCESVQSKAGMFQSQLVYWQYIRNAPLEFEIYNCNKREKERQVRGKDLRWKHIKQEQTPNIGIRRSEPLVCTRRSALSERLAEPLCDWYTWLEPFRFWKPKYGRPSTQEAGTVNLVTLPINTNTRHSNETPRAQLMPEAAQATCRVISYTSGSF